MGTNGSREVAKHCIRHGQAQLKSQATRLPQWQATKKQRSLPGTSAPVRMLQANASAAPAPFEAAIKPDKAEVHTQAARDWAHAAAMFVHHEVPVSSADVETAATAAQHDALTQPEAPAKPARARQRRRSAPHERPPTLASIEELVKRPSASLVSPIVSAALAANSIEALTPRDAGLKCDEAAELGELVARLEELGEPVARLEAHAHTSASQSAADVMSSTLDSTVTADAGASSSSSDDPGGPAVATFDQTSDALRDYQDEAIDCVLRDIALGKDRLLVQIPTGGGKTVIFVNIVRMLGRRTLIVVHRKELVDQAVRQIKKWWPDVEVGRMDGGTSPRKRDANLSKQVVVGTVQVLSREATLEKVMNERFGLIVVDEAHHAVATTYMNVIDVLLKEPVGSSRNGGLDDGLAAAVESSSSTRTSDIDSADATSSSSASSAADRDHAATIAAEAAAGDAPPPGSKETEEPCERPVLIGFTATAFRRDKAELGQVFHKVSYEVTITDLIHMNHLCPVLARRTLTHIDLSGVRLTAADAGDEDYNLKDLTVKVNTSARNQLIAQTYVKHAADRRAVAFCCDIQHSENLCMALRGEGVKAEVVHSKLRPTERAAALERFRNGEVQVLTNCEVLTEGIDIPAIACILMARPTTSNGLYTQCVGRGLRLFPGKKDCLVLDFTDNKHSLGRQADLSTVLLEAQLPEAEPLQPPIAGSSETEVDVTPPAVIMGDEEFKLLDWDPEQDFALAWIQDNGAYYLQVPQFQRPSCWLRVQGDPAPSGSDGVPLWTISQLDDEDVDLPSPTATSTSQCAATASIAQPWRRLASIRNVARNSTKCAVLACERFILYIHPGRVVSRDAIRLLKLDMPWRQESVTPNQRRKIQEIGGNGHAEVFRQYDTTPALSGVRKGTASSIIGHLMLKRRLAEVETAA